MTLLIFKQAPRERDRALRGAAPGGLKGHVAATVRSQRDVVDLTHRLGGRDAKPFRPVLVDTGGSRVLVVGDGIATAAELSELASSAIEKQEATRKRTGADMDWDAMREQAGQMRREDVDAAMRNAFRDAATAAIKDPTKRRIPAYYTGRGYKKIYTGV